MLDEICTALDARYLIGPNSMSMEITSISTDSRCLKPGDVFVALKGERFDGGGYVLEAFKKGAVAVIVQDDFDHQHSDQWQTLEKRSGVMLAVADTVLALGQLACLWQSQHSLHKVAITGSCGKTTVKELIASILRQSYDTLATEKNFNNEVGVPLTLLNIQAHHQAAVLELGASKPGDIAYSGKWVDPNVAVITNAGRAHLEGMGSVEGVAKTKGELIDTVVPGGFVVLNADDRFIEVWQKRARSLNVITCSLNLETNADLIAVNIDNGIRTRFEVKLSERAQALLSIAWPDSVAFASPLQGVHNIINALQAIAVGLILKGSVEAIRTGLMAMQAVSGRLQIQKGWRSHIKLLDDTYNANPNSVKAAIDVLAELPGQRLLVLGDMAELGDYSLEAHHEIGAFAREQGIDQLIAIGRFASATLAGFGAGGIEVANFEQAAVRLKLLTEDDAIEQTILLKGSRSAGVDQLLGLLTQQNNSVLDQGVL